MSDYIPYLIPIALILVLFMAKRAMMGTMIKGSEARKLVADGGVLIDVRSKPEYAAGHVEGAKNIPLDQVASRIKEFPKDKDIVVYCRSGARSGQAKSILVGKGFEKVHNLGPMSAW